MQGVKKGAPHLLVSVCCGKVGTVIELKRVKGGRLSDEQKDWLGELANRNWHTTGCKDAGEVADTLEQLGYLDRRPE